MSWLEISPGHFERPLDTTERFYRDVEAVSGRESPPISAVARFRMDQSLGDSVSALQLAWKAMRIRYPQMAAVDKEDTYVYDVPDATALESWLTETFLVVSPRTTTAGSFAKIESSSLAKLHYFPHTSEILFHCPHWRIDGIGVLMFLGQFFDVLAKPGLVEFGKEGANLSPSLEVAGNVPSSVSAEGERLVSEMTRDFVPSMGLPIMESHVLGPTARCQIDFSPHQTSAIVSRCRLEGISVTSATHAAIVCQTQLLAGLENPSPPYMSMAIFDLRKYCPPPYNSNDHAVTIYQTAIPALVVPSTFSENALQLHKVYSRSLTSLEPSIFSILRHYHETGHAIVNQGLPPGFPPPTAPEISSLGIVDRYLPAQYGGKVEIMDFWIGVKMSTRALCIHLWTRQDRMRLSVSYNESFYTAEFVDAFLDKVKGILLKELHVQDQNGNVFQGL